MNFVKNKNQLSLNKISYYQTGGNCENLFFPQSTEEVSQFIKLNKQRGKPLIILGEGSNSLITDNHWPGDVICLAKLHYIKQEKDLLQCGAGVQNTEIALKALEISSKSCAWMHRLPGQIGATVRMNARCYGGEISQIVRALTTVSKDGEIRKYQTWSDAWP